MKAQAAFEYMVLIGVLLAVLFPLSIYIWQQSALSNRTRQAEIAADTIGAAADSVYAQGPGAKTTVNVYIPEGYVPLESNVSNRTVKITVITPGGHGNFLKTIKANITGFLPNASGYQLIKLEVIDGYVNVSSV